MESRINIPPAIDSKVQKCTLDDKVQREKKKV